MHWLNCRYIYIDFYKVRPTKTWHCVYILYTSAYLFKRWWSVYVQFKWNYVALRRKFSDNKKLHLFLEQRWIIGNLMWMWLSSLLSWLVFCAYVRACMLMVYFDLCFVLIVSAGCCCCCCVLMLSLLLLLRLWFMFGFVCVYFLCDTRQLFRTY